MTQVVSDLTISVERTYEVDSETLFEVLLDSTGESAERVSGDGTGAPVAGTGPPPRLRAGETYVGEVDVSLGASTASFETYFTVESTEYPQFVLSGGGDADAGSFDATVVVAIADVPEGSVVRVDVKMDIAGDVVGMGAESVRGATTRTVERYFSRVDRVLAQAS